MFVTRGEWLKNTIGKIRINSTSKIRNTKVTKKNCKENGNLLCIFGENPHSKGLSFSASFQVLLKAPLKTTTTNSLRASLAQIISGNISIQ